MSHNDVEGSAVALPDEGLIHEWLDGQLDEEQSARLEALVTTSPVFAAQVAEARGLVAGSTRVLLALDGVPAGVVPGAVRPEATSREPAPHQAASGGRRPSGLPWRQWGAAAAVLLVGVTGVVLLQQDPESALDVAQVAVTAPLPGAARGPAAGAAPSTVALPSAGAASTSAASPAAASASASEVASAATSAAESATVPAPSAARSAETSGSVGGRSAPRAAPESLVSPARRTGERVAADEALRPAIEPVAAAKASGAGATRSLAAPALGRNSVADSEAVPEFESDLSPNELMFAVQRVSCAPACTQRRYEIARDGRVRRFTRASLVGPSQVDSGGVVSEATRRELQAMSDDLGLADLPGTLALDGGRCRSLSALRESLRVEFVVAGQRRSVMGLPWCSDGSHPMDKVAEAVADAVESVLRDVPDEAANGPLAGLSRR